MTPVATASDAPCRLLVVVPNWVGDVVLASPTLAALRAGMPRARITYLLRRYVGEIVDGCGWHDECVYWSQRGGKREGGLLRLAGRLRAGRFDLAVLLTNSFRSALTVRLAGIPRRVGYARELRGWLLTDRLRPLRRDGVFVPASVLPYYAKLAEHVRCPVTDYGLRLAASPEQQRQGAALLAHYGLDDGRPYAVVNPGAKFGAAKCWLPERFAELCDRLHREHDLRPVLVGSPDEAPLMRQIAEATTEPTVCCVEPGTTLGSLKVVIGGAALLVCNDTGPRHYGLAFGVPTVTLFGPTHQEWTDTGSSAEIKLQVSVDCGPCQLPRCPLDHRCMTRLTTDMVMQAVAELLGRRASVPSPTDVTTH
ncbi:MAG: lipopolysaccharide heptosyltransferase II [Phycisphaerae bacterium]|jgi:heptosyltransferase-2